MKRRLRFLCVSTLGTVALVVACNEVNSDPILAPGFGFSDGTIDAGGAVELPPDPIFVCPTSFDENTPCEQSGVACERGTNSDPACNHTLQCIAYKSDLVWHEVSPTSDKCRVQFCPPTAQIVDGAPCVIPTLDGGAPAADDEMQCLTDTQLCGCTTGRDSAHAHAPTWVCTNAGDGCPVSRPNLGTACLGDRSCDYGSCTLKRGTGMKCEQGVWQVEAQSCDR